MRTKIHIFSRLLLLPYLFMLACSGTKPGSDPAVDPPVVYDGTVETYRYGTAAIPSTWFSVQVNGEPQFLYPTPEPQLAVFGCDGKVKVEIRALKEKIQTVVVRPISKNYQYTLADNVVTLAMEPRDRIVVEINGDEENPLFLFANPIDTQKPDRNDPDVLFYEAGKVHDLASLTIQSGQRLYIEGGAIVNAAGTVSIAQGASGVQVSGGGILNSTGDEKGFYCYRNTHVAFADMILLNKDGWSFACVECSDVTFDNFKLIATASSNSQGHENGGINLVGCGNVTQKHCFSFAWDDTYCIKSQKWAWAGEVRDISYEDCIAWNKKSGNGFEIGYELNLPVSDISYKDIYVIHSGGRDTEFRRGGISIHNGAGGKVSNVSYQNVYIEDAKEYGFHMQILKTSYDIGTGVEWSPGYVEGVTLRNVRLLKQAAKGNLIKGYDADHTFKNITFDGLYIDGVRITNPTDAKIQLSNSNPTFL